MTEHTLKDIETVYLYPSALIATKEPRIIHTILGSCVSVCLFDKTLSMGGINHYMLPYWNGQGLESPKYGNIAIEKLYHKLLHHGSNKNSIIAKVFGGGEVIENISPGFNIGQRNIDVAHEILAKLKVPIIAESTAGKYGRKILFNSSTGEVTQKYIKSSTS